MFVNMFDTIGTLLGVSRRANLLTPAGKLPRMGNAMTADAAASVAGAALGFITHVSIKVGTGRFREVSLLTYSLAVIFLLRYLFDLT